MNRTTIVTVSVLALAATIAAIRTAAHCRSNRPRDRSKTVVTATDDIAAKVAEFRN